MANPERIVTKLRVLDMNILSVTELPNFIHNKILFIT